MASVAGGPVPQDVGAAVRVDRAVAPPLTALVLQLLDEAATARGRVAGIRVSGAETEREGPTGTPRPTCTAVNLGACDGLTRNCVLRPGGNPVMQRLRRLRRGHA